MNKYKSICRYGTAETHDACPWKEKRKKKVLQGYRCILIFYTQIKLVLHGTRRGNESWRGKVAFNAQVQFTNKHAGVEKKKR